ncbi:LANO_0B01112g1_1 [Lachancea nothofagi CBS 11611]|uniref:LANO_0B01112g1_1 n=1 Tax=Lachancea nothofagi CBS 11611 TaxID=1266666 RepID=A0A1G4IUS4_9SACH|nr:LANO_0B01112g1_1 [Lachancea nothofagi CBS 11611]
MHNRSTLQNGLWFGAPVALFAGILSQFHIPMPAWLASMSPPSSTIIKTTNPVEMYDVVHICHCNERAIEWQDVFDFLRRKLTQPDLEWMSLAVNLLLTLNLLLIVLRKIASNRRAKVTASSAAGSSSREVQVLQYSPRERALLQFQKLKLMPLNFKCDREDVWDFEGDDLINWEREYVPGEMSEQSTDTLRSAIPTVSPPTQVASVLNVTLTPQRVPATAPQPHIVPTEGPIGQSDTPSLRTPKLKIRATTISSSPTQLKSSSPVLKSVPTTAELLENICQPPTQSSSRTSSHASSVESNARSTLRTPENFIPSYHQPSPAKSTIVRTEVTQEQVYSQPFLY